jgi:hypothetical protein
MTITLEAQVGHSFVLVGLESHKVPVTLHKMTNLVFPFNLGPGIKVSKDISAHKVKGVRNVVELKALIKNFTPTNLSVYGLDGKLYSFDLEYAEDPPVLNFAVVNRPGDPALFLGSLMTPIILAGLPVDEQRLENDAGRLADEKVFLHRVVRRQGMQLRLKGIYLKDSLLWLAVTLTDQSLLPYRPEFLQLSIVDRSRAKRTAIQRVVVDPVYGRVPSVVEGASSFSLGYAPFTIGRDKILKLEIAERTGGRTLQLLINGRLMLRARRAE